MRRHRPNDQWWIHRDEVKTGLLLLDKVPGGLLGERLGNTVRGGGGLMDVGKRAGIPRSFGEGCVGVGKTFVGENGGERGCDDDALDAGG